MTLNSTIARVTDRVIARSKASRQAYLDMIAREGDNHRDRAAYGCSNLAHAYAGAVEDQKTMAFTKAQNFAIVSAYNDMLSAHQPYARFPDAMKIYAREVGATAQMAGGVPAMCDGVTQGMDGMDLSLFSRDTIALSTAIAMSHAMFDGMALLGICDKIVPGLVIGALRFGHLPAIFVPSGPMPSGIANKEKQKTRQLYAQGLVGREELLKSEMGSYHSPGTCTFYGTANSNQMMMEMMGLQLPGSSFVPPNTPLRSALTREAVHRLARISRKGDTPRPMGEIIDEKAILNACIGLLATGGSTNHAIHLPAMARAAGVLIDWADLDELSSAVPLIARVYPNGNGDVNHFHAAGGMGYVISELSSAGLCHTDILTVADGGFAAYATEPYLDGEALAFRPAPATSGDPAMLATVAEPFLPDGGMRLVQGNLGRATFKTSAVDKERWTIEAPARVFATQEDAQTAFKAGELDRDVVVVLRFQGPRANGMPELHKLTPPLGILQDKGFKVALVTDGRMSGASGKVPAAIHVTPEALADANGQNGPLAYVQDGDIIRLCAVTGTLEITADLSGRSPAPAPAPAQGTARELFAMFRLGADGAEKGGSAMLAMGGL
jgi:phosphogluconate dehydratase